MEMRGLRYGVPIHTQSKVQTNSGLETAKGKEIPHILDAGGGERKGSPTHPGFEKWPRVRRSHASLK